MDERIVCDCNGIEAQEVLDYIEAGKDKDKSLEEIMEELDIGTACGCCEETDCDRIDIHISELIKR